MKVIYFQLQIKEYPLDPATIIMQVDPSAPVPQALEGGDGNGALYLCILDSAKLNVFDTLCKSNYLPVKLYTKYTEFDLDKTTYRPDYYVHWQFGDDPVSLPEKN
jgi:hypothetical protein